MQHVNNKENFEIIVDDDEHALPLPDFVLKKNTRITERNETCMVSYYTYIVLNAYKT